MRNAVIAVLAYERSASLWDAARLLSVGEEGYAYRRAVGARVRTLPELKEIALFFTGELSAQLADARSTTTSKLDAPVNKLARLLNSASIKRVLLNESLRVDFERIISHFGWRQTMLSFGVLEIAVVLPLAAIFLRPAPEMPLAAGRLATSHRAKRVLGWPPNLVFALLAVASVFCCMPMAMPQAHLPALCSDLGIAASHGAAMLSVLLGTAFVPLDDVENAKLHHVSPSASLL